MRTTIYLLSLIALTACGPQRVEHGGGPAGDVEIHDPPDVQIEGNRITIDDHIHFATDDATILPESFELLDHLAQLLGNHPEITTVHIVGHTDSTGTPEHNMELSLARAESVEGALRTRGVRQTLSSDGRGETERLCQEDTDECHAQNRRVVFEIEFAE